MVYDFATVTNTTSILGVYEATNSASSGLLSTLTLITIFIVILIALLRNNPVPEAFLSASSFITIITLIFMFLDLATIFAVIASTLVWAASAIALYKSNSV